LQDPLILPFFFFSSFLIPTTITTYLFNFIYFGFPFSQMSDKGKEKEKDELKEKEKDELKERLAKLSLSSSWWEKSDRSIHHAFDDESEAFQMYSHVYSELDPRLRKTPEFPQLIAKTITQFELEKKFPGRFKLSLAKEVFDSFLRDWKAPHVLKDLVVFFEHDKITYRGEIRREEQQYKGQDCWSTKISLPNDGFFYPHPAKLKVLDPTPKFRHGSAGWIMLDRPETLVFDSIRSFCTTMLGGKPGFHLYYNFNFNMMDFQAINKTTSDMINVSFHYGTPETDFDDEWLE